jgi:hypothetical protein
LERGVFEASDLTIYHDINDGFHETPLAAARNRILAETIRSRHPRGIWSAKAGYLPFTKVTFRSPIRTPGCKPQLNRRETFSF